MAIEPVITSAAERPREGWDEPARGTVSWYTLISGDITPTDSLTAGIAEIEPDSGALRLHRHSHAEVYLILEGTGTLSIDGRESGVSPGQTIFIPGHAAHGLRNDSGKLLRLFYVFAADRFSDIVYRFDAGDRDVDRASSEPRERS